MITLTTDTHGFKVNDLLLICDSKRYCRIEEVINSTNMTVNPVSFIANLYYRFRATLNRLYEKIKHFVRQ